MSEPTSTVFRSTELRWFIDGSTPPAVREWWEAQGPAVEEPERTDVYVPNPEGHPVSVKWRNGALEVKRRLGERSAFSAGASTGWIDAWMKWTLRDDGAVAHLMGLLPESGRIHVTKRRQVRRFDAAGDVTSDFDAAIGQMELTVVLGAGADAWSLALETFDADEGDRTALVRKAACALADWKGPPLRAAEALAYPGWLLERAASLR